MKPLMLVTSTIVAGLVLAGPALGVNTAYLPAEQVHGKVSYVTGGIGEDEAAAFKNAAATYPLEMLFVQKAQPKDEFVADVKVSVRDRSGTSLLETTADGPFLLARLPSGKYKIEAEYHGERKQQAVEIRAGKHQREVFIWASRDDAEKSALNTVN